MRKELLGLKIFAVGLAILLWLQSAMLGENRAILNIPVQLINAPKDVSIDKTQESIPYIVEGRGIDIVRFVASRSQISIDASKIKPGVDLLALDDYQVELPPGVELDLIGPANAREIAVKAESFQQEVVPIELSFQDKSLRSALMEKKFRIQPEKVEIYGSARVLRGIESIKTVEITNRMLSQNQVRLNLVVPNRDLTVSEKYVTLSLENRRSEARVISAVPLTDADADKYFPNSITVKVTGSPEALAALTASDLTVSIATTPEPDGSRKVSVSTPDGINLVALTPEKVRSRF